MFQRAALQLNQLAAWAGKFCYSFIILFQKMLSRDNYFFTDKNGYVSYFSCCLFKYGSVASIYHCYWHVTKYLWKARNNNLQHRCHCVAVVGVRKPQQSFKLCCYSAKRFDACVCIVWCCCATARFLGIPTIVVRKLLTLLFNEISVSDQSPTDILLCHVVDSVLQGQKKLIVPNKYV